MLAQGEQKEREAHTCTYPRQPVVQLCILDSPVPVVNVASGVRGKGLAVHLSPVVDPNIDSALAHSVWLGVLVEGKQSRANITYLACFLRNI